VDSISTEIWSLKERHFLVTGAASGIGRAVALLFDRLGAKLSLVDRDEAGLNATQAACGDKEHRHFRFDLRVIEAIDGLVDDAVKAQGPLRGLVHAAGIQAVSPARVLRPGQWRDILTVNTESAMALARNFHSQRTTGPYGSSIVFISSIMALAGSPGAIAYSASKAALHGMARSMAMEFAPRNIRVNCVAPGFVRTPMYERTEQLWDDEQKKAVEANHPLGIGAPEDIANAVAFLCCDTGRWITGTVLVVDGGYLAR